MAVPPDSDNTPSPFALTAVDRAVLAMTDEEFHPHTWDELKQIIAEHNLSVLKRWPSDLRRYIKWSTETKAAYGSVPNFVMKERLKWDPLPSSQTGPKFDVRNPVPFADTADYQILVNDWPYGLAPGIKHIIVWLKSRLESEPTRGDMTPKSRQQVEDFIRSKFIDRVQDLPGEQEKVIWFKNWTALQSVPGMEHIHVLLRDVPDEIIREWTGGDQPINN
ncbi:hypothetical protein PV04_10865 [Phialophora macrospora]|uniref:N-acetylglucosamine-induced protein 1 n=1 Tax=Phialophora macrospora TaxID=1851006 RepID=A0A0D2DJY6_9EURO|nr:hypothetical protein PV04_10865 [Phialophora macrospora]